MPFVLLVGFSSACGNPETSTDSQPSQADKIERTEEVKVTIELTDDQVLRVCQIGQGFRVSREPDTIQTKATPDGLARLTYTRDDGQLFRYDCKIDGSVLRFRMIDEAGQGTGPGMWSGNGSQTTYQISSGKITIQDVFSDGSSDQKTYDFP